VLKLDEAKEVVSDGTGSYLLLNVSPGEHTLTLDLDSLPVYYLPKTALTKEIILSEGAIYNYNIPLRKIEE
jgi:hypothetical protein